MRRTGPISGPERTNNKLSEMNKPTKQQLNAMRDECYKIACEHGFHDEKLSERHFLGLVISELMEAVEADRKGRHADIKTFNAALDGFDCEVAFEAYIKDTVEDEMADAAIRILDLAGTTGDDIGEGFEDVCKRAKEADNFLEDEFYRRERFTESIYMIVDDIITAGCDIAMFDLFLLADVMGFDLMEHIRLKMNYNRTRERLHGKRY